MKIYDPSRDHDPLFSVTRVGRSKRPLNPLVLEPANGPGPSVRFGVCPGHAGAGKLTGLVPQGGHLAWRHHTKRTWSGVKIECGASGQRLCDAPAGVNAQHAGPFCTCHGPENGVSR
jgi:hypothetical protein